MKGNEKADKIATEHMFQKTYEITIPYSDFKPQNIYTYFSMWIRFFKQIKWDICVGNKLHEINDTFPLLKNILLTEKNMLFLLV